MSNCVEVRTVVLTHQHNILNTGFWTMSSEHSLTLPTRGPIPGFGCYNTLLAHALVPYQFRLAVIRIPPKDLQPVRDHLQVGKSRTKMPPSNEATNSREFVSGYVHTVRAISRKLRPIGCIHGGWSGKVGEKVFRRMCSESRRVSALVITLLESFQRSPRRHSEYRQSETRQICFLEIGIPTEVFVIKGSSEAGYIS